MANIINTQQIPFKAPGNGLYVLKVTASAADSKSDMCIDIDDIQFREIPPEKYIQRFNIPASWNGATLRGQTQTNIYLIPLNSGSHTITVATKGQINNFQWNITRHDADVNNFNFDLNLTANNLERQPFVNIILVDRPLDTINATVTTNWHYASPSAGDGDDIKLIIDNSTYVNDERTNYMWHATSSQGDLAKIETKTAYPKLETGLHYIQFIADRSPTLHSVQLQLSSQLPKNEYQCQIAIRKYGSNYKLCLGIYIPSGTPTEINNSNVILYYKNSIIPTGPHDSVANYKTMFDLNADSALIHNDEDGNWWYYGVDTSWSTLKANMNDLEIIDSSNWRLVKRKSS